MAKKRVTVTIDSDVYTKLRSIQSDKIKKTNDSMSLSETINDALKICLKK